MKKVKEKINVYFVIQIIIIIQLWKLEVLRNIMNAIKKMQKLKDYIIVIEIKHFCHAMKLVDIAMN